MKSAMNFIGTAFRAYESGDRDVFYFASPNGKKYKHDLGRYFRSPRELSRLEKKLIGLSRGKILDIGCATGYYVPALMKKGEVTAIDITTESIRIAREKGLRNCFRKDIFTFKTRKKFNTITLLENNLGLSETLPRAKQLLRKLSRLLEPGGQILTLSKKFKGKEYEEISLFPIWKNKKGPKFRWINFNIHFLIKLCQSVGLRAEVVDENTTHFLVRITKQEKKSFF